MKRNIVLMLVLVGLVSFNSCTKELKKEDCELKKYGTIMVSNSSSNPYDIYIDNFFKVRLSGGGISDKIQIDEGNNRKVYAKQVSGYLLFPTERTSHFNVVRCSNYTWQIP